MTVGEGWRAERCTEADKSNRNVRLYLRVEEVYTQLLLASLGR